MTIRTLCIAALATASGLSLAGCATKDYVNEQIAAVNTRISGVEGKVDALSGRVDTVNSTAQAARQRADAAYTLAEGKFTATALSSTEVLFDTNKWALSDEAKTTLTALADKLKADNKNVYLTIEGHGDPRGKAMDNRILGEKRALEVRHFLVSQGVPVTRTETISWGESQQVEPQAGQSANEANRRVVVTVYG